MFHTYEHPNVENLSALIESTSLDKAKRNALKHYQSMLGKKNVAKVEHVADEFGRYKSSIKKGSKRTGITGVTFPQAVRASLFGGRYDDLDIVNASGSIMYQLFKNLGQVNDCMERYYKDRDKVLRSIMKHYDPPLDRETAKTMVIEVFFGGDGNESLNQGIGLPRKGKHELPEFIEELKAEYHSSLVELMSACEEEDESDEDYNNPYFLVYKWASRKCQSKGKSLWCGSFASCLYQSEERKILDVIISEIREIAKEKYIDEPIGSLIHDGLHVRKTLNIVDFIGRIEEKRESILTLVMKSSWLSNPWTRLPSRQGTKSAMNL